MVLSNINCTFLIKFKSLKYQKNNSWIIINSVVWVLSNIISWNENKLIYFGKGNLTGTSKTSSIWVFGIYSFDLGCIDNKTTKYAEVTLKKAT